MSQQSQSLFEVATKVQARAQDLHFDWPDVSGVIEKVKEELAELVAEIDGDKSRQIDEFGDLMLVVIYLGNYLALPVEEALSAAVNKFNCRFNGMLALASQQSIDFKALTIKEKERLWQQVKKRQA